MPRGRAGLMLIAPERVREAFRRWYSWRGPTHIAEIWFVSERTVRRWQKTGLPLCYGNVWIEPDEWAAFEKTGKCPRTKPPIATSTKNEKVSGTRSRTGVDRAFARFERHFDAVARASGGKVRAVPAGRRKVSARSRGQVRP